MSADLRANLVALAEALRNLGTVGELTRDPQVSTDPVWVEQADAHLAAVSSLLVDVQRLIVVTRSQLADIRPAVSSAELRDALEVAVAVLGAAVQAIGPSPTASTALDRCRAVLARAKAVAS